MQGGASARTAAYCVVHEERTRSDNAADGHSWTGSYLIVSSPHTVCCGVMRSSAA